MSWCKRHLWDLYAASQLIDDLSIATDASSLSSGWVYLLLLHGPVHIAEVGGGGGEGGGGRRRKLRALSTPSSCCRYRFQISVSSSTATSVSALKFHATEELPAVISERWLRLPFSTTSLYS